MHSKDYKMGILYEVWCDLLGFSNLVFAIKETNSTWIYSINHTHEKC